MTGQELLNFKNLCLNVEVLYFIEQMLLSPVRTYSQWLS